MQLLVSELEADCEAPNANGATPFYVSCEKGHTKLVEFLGSRVNVTRTNANGVSALWIACQDGHLDVVRYVSGLAPELLELPKDSGATPFCIACHQGHLSLVQFLADQGVDVERPNIHNATPLYYAASNGHLAVVSLLLSRGVSAETSLDAADSDGCTPFFASCRQGRLRTAMLLADHGADINTQSATGQTALEAASAQEHSDLVEWLGRIQSFPQHTPRLIPALQRLAWARINDEQPSLIADLVEAVGRQVPVRVRAMHDRDTFSIWCLPAIFVQKASQLQVPWRFVLRFDRLQSCGSALALPEPEIEPEPEPEPEL